MQTKIYALYENGEIIRYIGKTTMTLRRRLAYHIADARNGAKNHRCAWIRMLLRRKLKPKIKLIQDAKGSGNKEERAWISFFLKQQFNLTNGTKGGDEEYIYAESKAFRKKKARGIKMREKLKQFQEINLQNDPIFRNAVQFHDGFDYRGEMILPYKKEENDDREL